MTDCYGKQCKNTKPRKTKNIDLVNEMTLTQTGF